MYKNKILFIDFDNTLTYKSKYPFTGELNKDIVSYIKKLSKYNKIVLWTCRTGVELDEAKKICDSAGLIFDGYNEFNGVKFIKPRCDIFIDDKSVRVNLLFRLKCFFHHFRKRSCFLL